MKTFCPISVFVIALAFKFTFADENFNQLQILSSKGILHYDENSNGNLVSYDEVVNTILGGIGLPTTVSCNDCELPQPDLFQSAKMNVFVLIGNSESSIPSKKLEGYEISTNYPIERNTIYTEIPERVSSALSKSSMKSNIMCATEAACLLNPSATKVPCVDAVLTAIQKQIKEVAPQLAKEYVFIEDLCRISSLNPSQDLATLSIVFMSLKNREARELIDDSIINLLNRLQLNFEDQVLAEILYMQDAVPSQELAMISRRLQLLTPTTTSTLQTTTSTPQTTTVKPEKNSTSNASSSDTMQPTISNIASYQVTLWTAILLVVILISAIGCLFTMDVGRDSLLYAKFQTDGGHRKMD